MPIEGSPEDPVRQIDRESDDSGHKSIRMDSSQNQESKEDTTPVDQSQKNRSFAPFSRIQIPVCVAESDDPVAIELIFKCQEANLRSAVYSENIDKAINLIREQMLDLDPAYDFLSGAYSDPIPKIDSAIKTALEAIERYENDESLPELFKTRFEFEKHRGLAIERLETEIFTLKDLRSLCIKLLDPIEEEWNSISEEQDTLIDELMAFEHDYDAAKLRVEFLELYRRMPLGMSQKIKTQVTYNLMTFRELLEDKEWDILSKTMVQALSGGMVREVPKITQETVLDELVEELTESGEI